MSSDVEMDDSSQSGTEIEPELAIAPDILTTRKPGPAHFVHKGKHYDWRAHEDNCRAYTKPSIITPERNRLTEEIIEASECLKNWWLIQQL